MMPVVLLSRFIEEKCFHFNSSPYLDIMKVNKLIIEQLKELCNEVNGSFCIRTAYFFLAYLLEFCNVLILDCFYVFF